VASSYITLEVPVVRLPHTHRVAVMRAALALCNDTRAASRFCLRLDLLVVRHVARLDALSPGLLRRMAREIAGCASRAQERFVAGFDARPAVPEQGVLSAWDRLGRPQPLPSLAPASVASQPPPSRPSSPASGRPSSPGMLPSMPARPITLRLSIPPALAADAADDDMPAVLSPGYADDTSGPASAPPSFPPMDPPPSLRASMLPAALPNLPAIGLRAPLPSTSHMRAITPSDLDMPPPSRRPPRPPPQDATTPEGKLCELLRHALSLATALSFEETPQATLLLVRAAVFRAVHEHHATVPNAVTQLYRATRPFTREIWQTRPDPGRAAPSVPVAEPALAALEQIVAARANVPKERPVTIEPWTTAAQAKESLGKLLAEIELAPPDPTLRHYLALGALCELLCRTRLPPATDQRLRDIVAFAQREGAKAHVTELMMTSIRKIVAG
jgi:hypothetical protein